MSYSHALEPPIALNDVINETNLRRFLDRADVQARLLPHLPSMDAESADPTGALLTNIRSPPFTSMLRVMPGFARTVVSM